MSTVERLLKMVESQDEKSGDPWGNRSLREALTEALKAQKPTEFYQKAWFIHGFWAGIVLIVLWFGLSQKGTLIYDLVLGGAK